MTLADLLLSAPRTRPRWLAVGASMIAIDSIVHNFLHRTGILRRLRADHAYGPSCYRPGGCADVIELIAAQINCKQFNTSFPRSFPRFV
jgi:hypothetical protein